MPSTPTPIYAIPGPDLDDTPADIEAAFDPMRNRIEEIIASMGTVPVGTQLAYSGSVLPDEDGNVVWAFADGGLVDRTVYDVFFARVGHAYNGGLDPGSNMVRLPDKRGRVSVGADGTAGRLTTGAGHSNALGQGGGAEVHALVAAENGAHAHAATQPAHTHNLLLRDEPPGSTVASSQAMGTHGSHVMGNLLAGELASVAPVITVASQGSGSGHNNVQPYEVDRIIVRIA